MNRPSEQDWNLLFSLAGTGANECPWTWEEGTDWPPEWGSRDYGDVIRRCAAYLRETGVTES